MYSVPRDSAIHIYVRLCLARLCTSVHQTMFPTRSDFLAG